MDWFGVVLMVLAGLCYLGMFVGMILACHIIAKADREWEMKWQRLRQETEEAREAEKASRWAYHRITGRRKA